MTPQLLKRYDTAFYVVTPSKYLHEFKTDDDFAKDPVPEASLYLPDCLIGAVDGQKFNVKGKNASSKMVSMSHEFAFKAHTAADAAKWHQIIASVAGQVTTEQPGSSAPSSPAVGSTQEGFGSSPTTTKSNEAYGTTNAGANVAGAEHGVVGGDSAMNSGATDTMSPTAGKQY